MVKPNSSNFRVITTHFWGVRKLRIITVNYKKAIIECLSSSITETSSKVTPDLHLTYSKNGGNLGLVLKMKNIACLSMLLTKHLKYTYSYLFKVVLYSIVAFREN